uniref:Uncharacterized protein n=1 Tax=Strix occidentalis caurina TaxID=311401 RepID=A0A8D0KZC7_STROC
HQSSWRNYSLLNLSSFKGGWSIADSKLSNHMIVLILVLDMLPWAYRSICMCVCMCLCACQVVFL